MPIDHQSGPTFPSALDDIAGIARQAAGKHIAVFLDYDRRLTPVIPAPHQAGMGEEGRRFLLHLLPLSRRLS